MPFIHDDGLMKQVDLATVVDDKLPVIHKLGRAQRRALIDLSRGVLAGMLRETDPSTYAHEAEVLYLDMGRGLSIALYPMVADMKMAVQSYVGYMAFKNGVPCAYGGGWLLFNESGFGINIFEPFRGGESAWIVAQLLRAYHTVFGVSSFTIDPYQIGYGNADGINSGAFWFYYHLGFRPYEREYNRMAADEWKKIRKDRSHRSDRALLETLAASSLRWTLPGSSVEPIVADRIAKVVTAHINGRYGGDRASAKAECLSHIAQKAGLRLRSNHPISRVAVLLEACGYTNAASPKELRRFVEHYQLKVVDERQYVRMSQTHRTLIDLVRTAERQLSS